MAYHWTDSSPWHAQQRRQRLEGQARRAEQSAYAAQQKLSEVKDELTKDLDQIEAWINAGEFATSIPRGAIKSLYQSVKKATS